MNGCGGFTGRFELFFSVMREAVRRRDSVRLRKQKAIETEA